MPLTYRDDRFKARGDDGHVYKVRDRRTFQSESLLAGESLEVEVERTILADGQLVLATDDGRLAIQASGVVIRRMQ